MEAGGRTTGSSSEGRDTRRFRWVCEQHRENRTQMLRMADYPIRAVRSNMDSSLQRGHRDRNRLRVKGPPGDFFVPTTDLGDIGASSWHGCVSGHLNSLRLPKIKPFRRSSLQ